MLTPCFHVFALKLNSGVIWKSSEQEPSQSIQGSLDAHAAALVSFSTSFGDLLKMQDSYVISFIDICGTDALVD